MPNIHVFFQPLANLQMLADLGVTHFWGPEVPNAKGMAPDALAAAQAAWIAGVAAVGGKCVLKAPGGPLPTHCAGVLTTIDEPNGKGVLPATVNNEIAALRAMYPGTPVYLSLAGDKITSANLRRPAELQLLTDYLAAADVVSVDCYSMNRNASRYKTTWTADAVKTVKAVRPDVRVVAWLEINDQRLDPPTLPDVNREPTPQEIDDEATASVAQGAEPGWFATCTGKQNFGWPANYWPPTNRTGASMALQYAKLGEIARRLNPPAAPAPPPDVPAPPAPPGLPAYVRRDEVAGMIADAIQAQQFRFYDSVLAPLHDLTDLHTKQLAAIRKNLAEAAAEGA